jgi:hypothetical protein
MCSGRPRVGRRVPRRLEAQRPDGGVTLTFFATPVLSVQPAKWSVTISRTYEVVVTRENVAKR